MEDLFPWGDLFVQLHVDPVPPEKIPSLPTEILAHVASFLPNGQLPFFALANSTCRSIAIRYLYSRVTLRGNSFSIQRKDPDAPLPDKDLPFDQILAAVEFTGCNVLKALLSKGDHIKAIRQFDMESYPSYDDRPLFVAALKHIWSNATGLKTFNHQYFPNTPLNVPDPCWPDSLGHLTTKHFCWWTDKALEYPTMRRLTMSNCSTTHTRLKKEHPHITHFDFRWHSWPEEDIKKFNFDWIAEVFPNLRSLDFGICTCWSDQGIPHAIYLNALKQLVANLPFLENLTLGSKNEYGEATEEEMAKALEISQPSLTAITFRWGNSIPFDELPKATWRRYGPRLTKHQLERKPRYTRPWQKPVEVTRWTPDPTNEAKVTWWLKRFGLPEISRPEMWQRWAGFTDDRSIPEERKLYNLVFEIIKQEILKEKKCTFEEKGACDCPNCSW